ncbi:ATP-binding protein [Oceanobacillus saliphilus]|uniref:ATP-binding protein n=1 Tax=Oceanobacillus saliphilus TaxID=2925834 RepID=UPI00201E5E12|nr:ATP-binding protein [Oceanobacillus saliphilus]
MEINNSDEKSPKFDKKSDSQLLHIESFAELPLEFLKWIERNTDGVFVLANEEGLLLYVTSSIEKVLGYKASDLIGTYWYEKAFEKDVNYVRKEVMENMKNGKNLHLNVLNNDGKVKVLECTIDKYVDNESGNRYVLVYLSDATYKKETEEMMIRSEKMNIAGQLAAGIAHEIRNPLTSLKGFLQLLQAGGSHKEEYFNIMIDEIDKIESITSELLFISKPLTEVKNTNSIERMIDDVVVLLEPQAKLKNIELVIKKPIQGEIVCDRSQIKQVLINLVKNAIEAMDEAGKITLSAEDFPDKVEVCISDEGAGIPDEIRNKLFEPFFTTKANGTGLGLLITKQILETHEAHMVIKTNKDRGSTFQLVFRKSDSK